MMNRRKTSIKRSVAVISALVIAMLIFVFAVPADSVTSIEVEVTHANRLVPVQAFDGGELHTLYVRSGEAVKRGQVLATLNRQKADSELAELMIDLEHIGVKLAYNNALSANSVELHLPKAITGIALKESIADVKQRLKKALARHRKHLHEFEKSLHAQEKEKETVEPLVRSGSLPEKELLDVESAISDLKRRRLAYIDGRAHRLGHEHSELTAKFDKLNARIGRLKDHIHKLTLRAPDDGVVNKIYVKSRNAGLRPGATLLDLVPSGDNLIVRGKLSPADRTMVRIGQKVKLTIKGLNAARVGRLTGVVKLISAQSSHSERGDKKKTFEVDIEITSIPKHVNLQAGLTLQANIVGRSSRLINYLITPVTRIKDGLFRQ